MRHRVILAVLALLCAVATAGCGASKNFSSDVVAQAADKTAATGTAKLSFTAGVAGQTMNGTGFVDLRGHAVRLSLVLPAGVGRLDEVMANKQLYMRFPPALARRLPGGKTWVKIDIAKVLESKGIDLGALRSTATNPADQLAQLRGAGDVKQIGTATIRGAQTTHYHAVVDLRRAADRAPASQRAAARSSIDELIKMTGTKTIPVDVWIDDAGRLRRMRSTQNVRGRAITMTMDFYDFGARETIQPPPASQTADLTSAVASHLS